MQNFQIVIFLEGAQLKGIILYVDRSLTKVAFRHDSFLKNVTAFDFLYKIYWSE